MDEKLRRELPDFEVEPPKDSWEKISERIEQKPVVVTMHRRRYWIAAAAVIALLMGTGTLLLMHQSDESAPVELARYFTERIYSYEAHGRRSGIVIGYRREWSFVCSALFGLKLSCQGCSRQPRSGKESHCCCCRADDRIVWIRTIWSRSGRSPGIGSGCPEFPGRHESWTNPWMKIG